MSRGISLHIGINKVGPNFPSAATLKGCESDANDMEKIAAAHGFQPHDVLLAGNANFANVTDKMRYAATQLQQGDIFLFTFAGHGFQEADTGEQDEGDDFEDETLLLYDFELYDDVLRQVIWPQFQPGVRILMVADSCHSGTVSMRFQRSSDDLARRPAAHERQSETDIFTPDGLLARTVSFQTMREHRKQSRRFYEQPFFPIINPPIYASVLLLAACGDAETTGDGDTNGIFTAAMLKVLKQSNPQDYRDLIRKIGFELANHPQIPVLTPMEPADEAFIGQKPFTI